MNVSFSPLLTVAVQHDYFPLADDAGVELTPAPSTLRTMRQLGIRQRSGSGNTELFYQEKDSSGRTALTDVPTFIRFTFLVRSQDPLFPNYTDLPMPNTSETYYFTNLHGTTNFKWGGKQKIAVKPPVFEVTGDLAGKTITLVDELDHEVASVGPEGETDGNILRRQDGEDSTVLVNQDALAHPGKYRIKADGVVLETFLRLPPDTQLGDLGLFTIYIGDTGAGESHILADGQVNPARLQFSFAARFTLWQYVIINNATDAVGKYVVRDRNTFEELGASATPPAMSTIANGTEGAVITLNTARALRKIPDAELELMMVPPNGDQESAPRISLPIPSAEQLNGKSARTGLPDEEGRFFSPVYVYV